MSQLGFEPRDLKDFILEPLRQSEVELGLDSNVLTRNPVLCTAVTCCIITE